MVPGTQHLVPTAVTTTAVHSKRSVTSVRPTVGFARRQPLVFVLSPATDGSTAIAAVPWVVTTVTATSVRLELESVVARPSVSVSRPAPVTSTPTPAVPWVVRMASVTSVLLEPIVVPVAVRNSVTAPVATISG